MANKKISQLDQVPQSLSNIYMVPVVSGSTPSTYNTCRTNMFDIKNYALDGWETHGNVAGFTGSLDVYMKKSNWADASDTNVENFPFLQVRASDGLLMTGSGVAFDSTSVPWNYVAAQSIDMDGNDINDLDQVRFEGATHSIFHRSNTSDIILQAERDLILSGRRDVQISGQGVSILGADYTVVSGGATISGGDLEIDPSNKLIVNEINTYTKAAADDPAILSISGSARFFSWETEAPSSASGDIYWKDSNIQFDSTDTAIDYYFKNVRDGQTLTMYVQNTHETNSFTPTFTNESIWHGTDMGGNDYYNPPVPVLWSFPTGNTVADMRKPPLLAAGTTNVYTFINIKTGIFASAITGYAY